MFLRHDPILNKIRNIPEWDNNYLNKIENVIKEFLENTKLTNKKDIMYYIMQNTQGHINPKIVDETIDKYL